MFCFIWNKKIKKKNNKKIKHRRNPRTATANIAARDIVHGFLGLSCLPTTF